MIRQAPRVVLALALAVYRPVVAQCPDGSPAPCREARPKTPTPISIAVLPFDNPSPDTTDAYLTAGLTEQILNRLRQLDRFRVRSASEGRYRGNVSYVVSGSVFPRPAGLRVSVELSNSSGHRVWGADYNRSADDIMMLVQDISSEIATSIAGELRPAERMALSGLPTRSTAAYDHYLRGLFLQRARDGPSVLRALREFQAAVGIDTTFARAFARIALACASLIARTSGASRDSLFSEGAAATDRALALDPTLGDAWLARGRLLALRYSPLYEGVLAAYERAIQLEPRNAEAQHVYATWLMRNYGDITRSRAAYMRAIEIEPDRAVTMEGLALTDFSARRFAPALVWADSAVAIAPNQDGFRLTRANIRFALGDTAGARADAALGLQTPDAARRAGLRGMIALLDARAGDTVSTRSVLDMLIGRPGEPDGERGLWVATLLLELGRRDEALTYLESVRPEQGNGFPLILSYLFLDPLRADPRFLKLVENARPR